MRLIFAMILALPTIVSAAPASYSGSINSARVQNYFSGNINVWGLSTGDKCGNNPQGNINFGGLTTEEKNRVWSTLLTSKSARKSIYIEYDNSNCTATSIAID